MLGNRVGVLGNRVGVCWGIEWVCWGRWEVLEGVMRRKDILEHLIC